MGVPGLWDAVKCISETRTIRQLVLEWHENHPRERFRIGVDMGMLGWVSGQNTDAFTHS